MKYMYGKREWDELIRKQFYGMVYRTFVELDVY